MASIQTPNQAIDFLPIDDDRPCVDIVETWTLRLDTGIKHSRRRPEFHATYHLLLNVVAKSISVLWWRPRRVSTSHLHSHQREKGRERGILTLRNCCNNNINKTEAEKQKTEFTDCHISRFQFGHYYCKLSTTLLGAWGLLHLCLFVEGN